MREEIEKTMEHMKNLLTGESSGHDWWHTYRVWNLGKRIGKAENVDLYVVELACLLHDIGDWKLNKGDENIGSLKAEEFLKNLEVDKKIIARVSEIIKEMNFKGAGVISDISSKEGKVVQDADKLDAMGAIGIARCFAFEGKIGEEIYNPEIKVNKSPDFYKKKFTGETKGTAINHFYEKLLLLKDRMNTKLGRELAEERHKFMELFLETFMKEWDGGM